MKHVCGGTYTEKLIKGCDKQRGFNSNRSKQILNLKNHDINNAS